jgi:hypothetical protein
MSAAVPAVLNNAAVFFNILFTFFFQPGEYWHPLCF